MSYVDDTEYAMRGLIHLATQEENSLAATLVRLEEAERLLKIHQWDFQTSDLHDDFSDAYVMAAFGRAAAAGIEVSACQREVATLQASVGSQQHSIQAICTSILQIARQGISLVHGSRANAPSGRALGQMTIRDVIWQGRNQAAHYDEGNFRQQVIDLFAALETSHGNAFSLDAHRGKCLAKQVVHLLGWHTYENYVTDARLLQL